MSLSSSTGTEGQQFSFLPAAHDDTACSSYHTNQLDYSFRGLVSADGACMPIFYEEHVMAKAQANDVISQVLNEELALQTQPDLCPN